MSVPAGYLLDTSLISRTRGAYPILKSDGSIVVDVPRSVRVAGVTPGSGGEPGLTARTNASFATGEWTYRRIEDKSAMNSCVGVDVNGDKRMDLVCTGAGGAIRWYENVGKR